MSTRTSRSPKRPHTNISARAVMRDPVDTEQLAGVLSELARARREADAVAQTQDEQTAQGSERRTA